MLFCCFCVLFSFSNYQHLLSKNNVSNLCRTSLSEFGCKDSISRKIILPNFCYVPNTFTPDGDEYNNVFVPIFYNYLTIIDYELTIFNRWGELIFTSYNPKIGWDGVVMKNSKKGQDDVYNWCLKYNDLSCPKRKEIIGHVTLIK